MNQRRPVAGPLLLALVFLAIIGASVGVALGWYVAGLGGDGKDPGDNAGTGTGVTTPQSPPVISTLTSSPPVTVKCPDVTQEAAKKPLDVVLYIRTELSQVWICKDADGKLWYQGNRLAGRPATDQLPAAISDNTLFLQDVIRDGTSYVATNGSGDQITTYRIARDKLTIDNPGTKNDSVEPVLPTYTYPSQ